MIATRQSRAAASIVIPTLAVLALLNLFTFALFGFDKKRAESGARRVPEARLLGHCALGGAPGGWIAMSVFRHKTIKTSFRAKMLGATVLCAVVYYVLFRLLLETPESAG